MFDFIKMYIRMMLKLTVLAASLAASTAGTDVIITPTGFSTEQALHALRSEERTRITVHDALSKHSSACQANVTGVLAERGVSFKSFWIDGSISVKGASDDLVEALRALPSVTSVEEEAYLHLPAGELRSDDPPASPGAKEAAQENIAELNAEPLWDAGFRGQGVVVASIDSGVRWTHEAVVDSFRGMKNGTLNLDFAYWTERSSPLITSENADILGHGSHVTGTLVGAGPYSIGMAPDAEWIHAAPFTVGGGASQSALLEAAQWVMCPTRYDVDHTGADCSLGADVVSASFGGPGEECNWLNPSVEAMRAAGMLPVFAAGNVNNNFECGSVMHAGASGAAIAVGGAMGGSLYAASGKGPGEGGVVKPDFVAPHSRVNSVLSAADTGRNAYMRLTGTSMSTPHVAGALALLLSAGAQPEAALQALQETAARDVSEPTLAASECGGTTYNGVWPNNIYGYGTPDVCAAANSLGVACP